MGRENTPEVGLPSPRVVFPHACGGGDFGSRTAAGGRTISVGVLPCSTTRRATLPNTTSVTPVRPWVAITTKLLGWS